MSGGTGASGFVYWARRVRIVLAITCGVPALLLIASVLIWSYLKDPADLVILAPDAGSAYAVFDVSVDGDHGSLDAGRFGTWKVEKGSHHVLVTMAGDKTPKVDREIRVGLGMEKYTVVPAPGQCFATFDVSDAWYGSGKKPPKVLGRYGDGAPFDLPHEDTYLFTHDTPSSIEEGHPVRLLFETRCDELKKSDADLVASAGLDRP